jgi:serine/threonine-protein kinase
LTRDTPDVTAPAQAGALLEGTAYRVIATLGRGGMGDVVEAEHVALGKRVVVKLLQQRHADRADYADRMRIEAQALAKIAHPNLVAVTDFGQTARGQTFLVMERLHGRTLREELEARGVLPVLEAIDVVAQSLAGLSAAHAAGLVHRDVKLDNLFLCDAVDGRRQVKVLDFGLAKVIGVMGESTPAPLAFPTAEGVAMGTPRFFSPEQATGKPVDPRTDVYAAGAVLYTLLAGRSPFEHHDSLLALARAHAFEMPEPPSRFAPQAIPPALDEAVLRALAKDPDERFPSAQAFAAELERIASHVAVAGMRPRWEQTEVMAVPPTFRAGADAVPKTERQSALPWTAEPRRETSPPDDTPPMARAQRSTPPPLELAPLDELATGRKTANTPLPATMKVPEHVPASPRLRPVDQAIETVTRASVVPLPLERTSAAPSNPPPAASKAGSSTPPPRPLPAPWRVRSGSSSSPPATARTGTAVPPRASVPAPAPLEAPVSSGPDGRTALRWYVAIALITALVAAVLTVLIARGLR